MKHPVSEEHEPLSSHNEISAFSTGLLVDTNLDTSVPDTYRPPPAPIPYETYIGRPSTPSRNQEESGHETEVALGITNVVRVEDINHGSPLETKVKKQPDNEEKDVDLEASKLMEDESSDELKKSSKVLDAPIIDEDDCPICLEGADYLHAYILLYDSPFLLFKIKIFLCLLQNMLKTTQRSSPNVIIISILLVYLNGWKEVISVLCVIRLELSAYFDLSNICCCFSRIFCYLQNTEYLLLSMQEMVISPAAGV